MEKQEEKGFKTIKIVESNYRTSIHSIFEDYSNKFIIGLIISLFVLFIFIFFRVHSIYNTKVYKIKYNIRNSKTKKINSVYIDDKIYNQIKNNTIINNEYYDIYNKTFDESKNPKISIIVYLNDNQKTFIERLINSIYKQNFTDLEINIINNNLNNTSILYLDKIIENDKRVNIIEYKENEGKLRERIDVVNISKGEYLIFIDGDYYFSSNLVLDTIYRTAKRDNIDIIEFNSFKFSDCEMSKRITQPELFYMMYFGKDDYYNIKEFHLNGKLIKKKLFVDAINSIDDFYKNQNLSFYEENMLLFILLKKAESFELLRINNRIKTYPFFNFNINKNSKELDEFLLYIKFIFEYSDNKVPEKRKAAFIFINYIKSFIFPNNNKKINIGLLKEIIDLYINCKKISDEDKNIIEKYKNSFNSNN